MPYDSADGADLIALEARLAQDLARLELPAKPWVPTRAADGQPVANVVIIGAGMAGLAAAASLRLLGVDQVRVLDRAQAGQEGPWVTFARMETLRSPKALTGPALGLPSLTPRAWFEARFGTPAWEALDKIPRALWMDYLVWYRRVMGIVVENGVTVALIRPRQDGLLAVETDAGPKVIARHVVLATGRDGLGGAFVPDFVRFLPRHLWAHSRDPVDFASLRGRRVGVIGAGASAMDNAASALEAGAASLELFVRRAALPRVNKFTGIGSPGVVHGFAGLPDDWKWRFLDVVLREQTPPPRDSTIRVGRHPNATLHLSSLIVALTEHDDTLLLTTPRGSFALDFLILATGFRVDLSLRPELALLAPHIRLWRDRFDPGEAGGNEELATSPDLAPDYGFQETVAGACPALARVHNFNHPATLSHGKLSGDIPAISEGAARLSQGIARALFVADAAVHFDALRGFDRAELQGDEWPPERIDSA